MWSCPRSDQIVCFSVALASGQACIPFCCLPLWQLPLPTPVFADPSLPMLGLLKSPRLLLQSSSISAALYTSVQDFLLSQEHDVASAQPLPLHMHSQRPLQFHPQILEVNASVAPLIMQLLRWLTAAWIRNSTIHPRSRHTIMQIW